MTVRRSLVLTCALAAVVALPACSGDGSVTLPTRLPSLTLPTTLPSISVPAITLPTRPSSPDQTVTQTQTQTQVQTETQTRTVAVTPRPTSTAPALEEAETGGSSWWLWLLAALIVIALAVTYFVVRARRRNAEWDKRLGDAQEQAAWFEDSLTAQLQARATAAEATAMWNAAQPRLLQLDEDLHAIISDAPDDDRRARAAILRERVAELARAQGAEASVSGVQSVDELRSLRLDVDRARAALREVLPTPSSTAR